MRQKTFKIIYVCLVSKYYVQKLIFRKIPDNWVPLGANQIGLCCIHEETTTVKIFKNASSICFYKLQSFRTYNLYDYRQSTIRIKRTKLTIHKTLNTVNFNDTNTDGLFTVAEAKLFFESREIIPIPKENSNLGIFYGKVLSFMIKRYVVCTH